MTSRSGSQNGEETTGRLWSCQDGEPFSAELDRFAFVITKVRVAAGLQL